MVGNYVVYSKETGETVIFHWPVDAKEAVATGRYTWDKPEDAP